MTDDKDSDSNVVSLRDDERDQQILKARLSGGSIRRLGREFKMSDRAILESLDRSLPPLTNEMRSRLFREDLCRLEDLLVHWYQAARNGCANSVAASQLCVRLMERRSSMLGLDSPTRATVELIEQGTERPNSTQQLLEQLDRIAAERGQPGSLDELETQHEPEPTPGA